MKKEVRMKVNIKIDGERVRQYIYIEKQDKLWLKEQAKKVNMSVSRYIADLIKKEIQKDIRLELKY